MAKVVRQLPEIGEDVIVPLYTQSYWRTVKAKIIWSMGREEEGGIGETYYSNKRVYEAKLCRGFRIKGQPTHILVTYEEQVTNEYLTDQAVVYLVSAN